jgi:hypothetical protein
MPGHRRRAWCVTLALLLAATGAPGMEKPAAAREQRAPEASSSSSPLGAPPACPAPGVPVTEPYRWYPSLDLARIPFHTASGPWGPRARIAAPEPPVTQRDVQVASAFELAAQARIPGTRITVGAGYIGPVVIMADVTDVDIVVPRGRTIAQLTIGRYNPASVTRRLRIRGTTPGTHSGGLVGWITIYSLPTTDIIIDGVDLNGANVGGGGSLLWHFPREIERVAVVNVRGHSVGAGSLQPGATDMVIAGSRFITGARPPEIVGDGTAWGSRGGNRIVIYDNRFDGRRFHRVRVHQRPGPEQYAWVANNTFVDPHEARIFSAFSVSNSTAPYAAVWAVCNQVYAHSTCMSPSFEAPDAAYAMLTGNAFFGSITEDKQRAAQIRHGAGRDYLSGNTFAPWRQPPAWTAPGDPAATVPLPPVDPSRHNAALASTRCPPP